MITLIRAIVIKCQVAWFCKRCRVGHQVLYKDGDESFCPKCVPSEIKSRAAYFNHVGESINYNGEE